MRLLPVLVLFGLTVATAGCSSSSTSTSTQTAASTTTASATGTGAASEGAGSTAPAPASPATPGDAVTPTAPAQQSVAPADATSSAEAVPSLPPSLAAAPDTPGTSLRPTTVASAASGEPVAVPTAAAKRFATAKLPERVGGYTGVVSAQAGGQAGQYTGSNPDDLLTAMLNPISATGAITRLQSPQKVGGAVCGAATDGSGMTCVVALDGGQLVVQGSDTSTAASLGRTTNQIVASFS